MAEYRSMFALDDEALSVSILGCGDGPASFNAEATRRGWRVTSVDPIYQFTRSSIEQRIAEVRVDIMAQLRESEGDYVWRNIESPDQLESMRLTAMDDFLSDFDMGLAQERYVVGSVPDLPFRDNAFDLALCSHFLFLYSQQFGYDEHLQSVLELVRVAKQVRIFPLSSMHDLKASVHLAPILSELRNRGFQSDIVSVDYEFMRGATEMLTIGSAKGH